MSDDALSHFDKLAAQKKQQDAERRASEEAAHQQRLQANRKTAEVFDAVVVSTMSDLKQELASRGVLLDLMNTINMGPYKANTLSFTLSKANAAAATNRGSRPLMTKRYTIRLLDDGTVTCNRLDETNRRGEELTQIMGRMSVSKLEPSYVNKLVTLAVEEWFELQP